MSKNKNSFFQRLKSKYLFSVRSENNFLESTKVNLNVFEILSVLALITFLLFLLFFTLFKLTPLKTLLGVDSVEQKQRYLLLEQRTDSIQKVLDQNKYYFSTIQKIVNGEEVDSTLQKGLTTDEVRDITISKPTKAELDLRDSVKNREMYSIVRDNSSIVQFLAPLEGVISNNFDDKNQHFGLDIIAKKNSPILATADGNVLYSSWNEKDGHTIILSHHNNFISIYKHNKKLLKNIGNKVKKGDAIAIIGNSGENTSGYHLHFELWQNGTPKSPLDYINYK